MYAFPAKALTPLVYDFSATAPILYDASVNALSLWIGVSCWFARAMHSAKACMQGILAMGKGRTFPSTGGKTKLALGPWAQVHEPSPLNRSGCLLV